jgi:lipopolysaccharide export system permease protein
MEIASESVQDKMGRLSNNKLIDIVKNYKRYNYDEEVKEGALQLLSDRGIQVDDLKLVNSDRDYEVSELEDIRKNYKNNALITIIVYFVTVFLNLVFFETENTFFIILPFILTLVYLVVYVKTYIYYHDFFKKTDGEAFGWIQQLSFFLIGIPLCFATFTFSLRVMRERIKEKY